MNSGEKVGIRTLALFMRDGAHTKQCLIVKDTGSYKYTICVENLPDNNLKYTVIKHKKTGKLIGEIPIHRVSNYGIEYDNTVSRLPDSVSRYIINHYKTFFNFLKIGENAFR